MYTALSITVTTALFFLSFHLVNAQAATASKAESNEVVTRVGNPAEENACGIDRVFYWQGDPKYQNICDMAGSGCGPSSMAMVLSSFGDTITPNQMDDVFRARNWRPCTEGSNMIQAIKTYLPEKGYLYEAVPIAVGLLDLAAAKQYLDNGWLIIGSTANHIFVVYGVDEATNEVLLMDPARHENVNGVRRPNEYPWIRTDKERGWKYAYAVKKEGATCNVGPQLSGPTDSVCKGTPVSFGQKKLLPRQQELVCKATRTGTCGRVDKCIPPTKIVIHTTVSSADADGIQDYFARGSGGEGVGTQFVIGKDGKTLQMVEMFTDTTEQSFGTANHNDKAINIELTDDNVYADKADAPTAQYQALLKLVKDLMRQYNIPKGNIGFAWKANSDNDKSVPPG
ncbi:MAG: N-acetylmuramoyl-L-alanine amidase, partial [Candidatus Levybacteria bacterium]|nr:N-acetylmuramoyl-L-alanine amidase [Candidatus Levybacteria bacterium]